MMIQDQVKALNSEIQRAFRDFLPVMAEKLIDGQHMRILTRTAAGVDYEGTDFAPYRPLTRQIRRSRGLEVNRVNLRFDDVMLNSIRPMYELTLFDGVIASLVFGDSWSEQKAEWIQDGVGMAPRVFFEVSNFDEQIMEDQAETMTDSLIAEVS